MTFTKGPWRWADGWDNPTLRLTDNPQGHIDKYIDLRLLGGNGEEIIPVRVDHYEPLFDIDEEFSTPSPADRRLIAAAPALVAALEALLDESDAMLKWLFERYRWNTVAGSENSVKYQALLHTTKQARTALALVEGEK